MTYFINILFEISDFSHTSHQSLAWQHPGFAPRRGFANVKPSRSAISNAEPGCTCCVHPSTHFVVSCKDFAASERHGNFVLTKLKDAAWAGGAQASCWRGSTRALAQWTSTAKCHMSAEIVVQACLTARRQTRATSFTSFTLISATTGYAQRRSIHAPTTYWCLRIWSCAASKMVVMAHSLLVSSGKTCPA